LRSCPSDQHHLGTLVALFENISRFECALFGQKPYGREVLIAEKNDWRDVRIVKLRFLDPFDATSAEDVGIARPHGHTTSIQRHVTAAFQALPPTG
jgi:hypothetical protein